MLVLVIQYQFECEKHISYRSSTAVLCLIV